MNIEGAIDTNTRGHLGRLRRWHLNAGNAPQAVEVALYYNITFHTIEYLIPLNVPSYAAIANL